MIISPGPGRPENSGVSLARGRPSWAARSPSSGSAWATSASARPSGAGWWPHRSSCTARPRPSPTTAGVFAGLPDPFEATRYHSLVVDRASLPGVLEITAETADGVIMGAAPPVELAIEGVQFHPESILTPRGRDC